MTWIAQRPLWVLVLVCVAVLALAALLGAVAGRRWFGDEVPAAASIAAPLMPALGAAFAVLAAFAVAAAASDLRDAEAIVAREATAAARLAWASSDRAAAGDEAQTDLLAYLDATTQEEWNGIDEVSAGAGAAYEEILALEQTVRGLAASPELGTPFQTELLGSVDELTAARRLRFAAATPVAGGVLALLAVSALALVVNATVLTLDRARRSAGVVTSLVVVTGVSIALAIALSGPFSGAFTTSARPLTDVAVDIEAGRFDLSP